MNLMSTYEKRTMTAEQTRQAVRQQRAQASVSTALEAPLIDPSLLADPADNTLKSQVLLSADGELTVSIPAWDTFAPPGFGVYDTLYIYHLSENGGREELFNRELDESNRDEFPLPYTVPRERVEAWGEGTQTFTYEVLPYSGGTRLQGGRLALIFDRIAPNRGNVPPAFAPIADVTDANVADVELTLGSYPDHAAGDKVAVYWLKDVPEDLTTVLPAVTVDVGTLPQQLKVPRTAIEAAGDGGLYALYLLVDKAGNISRIAPPTAVGVALGPLPSGLKAPEVPLAGDGVIDQEDVFTGVSVHIPAFEHFKPTDELQVTWGSLELGWQPIGNAPSFPLAINLLPLQVWGEYAAAGSGAMSTPVSYALRRGAVPAGTERTAVDVNLERIGPVDPGPDPTWPDPVNPKLDNVTVKGEVSGKNNELTPDDQFKPATLTFVLDSTFIEGDKITFHWGGTHITEADHEVLDTDPGEQVTATIPWAYIEAHKNGVVPVHYRITRDGVPNASVSPSTDVTVTAIVLVPDAPEFLGGNTEAPVGWLTCRSLYDPDDDSGAAAAIRVQVPDLAAYGLVTGAKVTMHWTAVHGFTGETPIPDIDKVEEITLTAESLNGFVWRVEPYDTHILPIPNFNAALKDGRARVWYTFELDGTTYTSGTEERIISMHQLGAACPLKP
jgi:hypothetical protein